jgi:hypothetical protein
MGAGPQLHRWNSLLSTQDFTPEKKPVGRAPRRGPPGGRKKKVGHSAFFSPSSVTASGHCPRYPVGPILAGDRHRSWASGEQQRVPRLSSILWFLLQGALPSGLEVTLWGLE